METEELIALLISFVITVTLYTGLPLLSKYIIKETYEKKEARKYAIYNSIGIYILFTIYQTYIHHDLTFASIPPAVIWGYVSYLILHDPKKDNLDMSDGKEKEDSSKSVDKEDTRYSIDNKEVEDWLNKNIPHDGEKGKTIKELTIDTNKKDIDSKIDETISTSSSHTEYLDYLKSKGLDSKDIDDVDNFIKFILSKKNK